MSTEQPSGGERGMRTDCRFYESRTYASGEVVRKCRLDLAPEAPWRCPAECAGFQRRTIDVAWTYGSLAEGQRPAEPAPAPLGDEAAAVLDAAEDIVNAIGPELLAEFDKKANKGKGKKRFRRKG